MRFLFSLALISLPVLDIATLIFVGGSIGAWPTVGLVVLSVIVGALLIRSQGFAILSQARKTLQAGRFPAREVFDGACALTGGLLLILPGFLSDVLGLMLLLPPFRALLLGLIGKRVRRSGHFAVWDIEPPAAASPRSGGSIIEGEYQTIEPAGSTNAPADNQDPPRSPWRRPGAANVVPPDET
jgi:UPF0716 protein FxsA